jgi:hypothetical protein
MADIVEFFRRAGGRRIPAGNQIQLGDADGNPIGTAGNPLVTSGGGAGGSDVNIAQVGGNAVTTAIPTSSADGANAAIGTTTDAEATANGGVIGLLKRLRTLLTGPYTAATPNTVTSGTGDTAVVAATAGLRLLGFACAETAGTPAVAELNLRHGADVSGAILVPVKLLANESRADWFGPDGIAVASGIFLDRVSGTTQITVFTKVVS